MRDPLDELKGGDRRSIGAVPEVVRRVLGDPALFQTIFDGISNPDPLVRMRCADAVEKITALHPEYLSQKKARLIELAGMEKQREVRWHIAQLLSRVRLNKLERRQVMGILSDYLSDNSKIVKTFAMQALADIAFEDVSLKAPILSQLENLVTTGSPAMKARGRKLLARLRGIGRRPETG